MTSAGRPDRSDVNYVSGVTFDPSSADGGPSLGSREERKARTTRALLDAALQISNEQGFSATSLRAVTKAAGIVPTAFYRHYGSMDALGETLVDESISTLRRMMRTIRSEGIEPVELIRRSIDLLDEWVSGNEPHFHFLARERSGGSAAVRKSVRRQLRLFVAELSVDLLVFPPLRSWSEHDRYLLAEIFVNQMVIFAERTIDGRDSHEQVLTDTRRQLRMVVLGLERWHSDPDAG